MEKETLTLLLYNNLPRDTVKSTPFKAPKMRKNEAWSEYSLQKLKKKNKILHR